MFLKWFKNYLTPGIFLADLMPAMLVKAANTSASISMFDTPCFMIWSLFLDPFFPKIWRGSAPTIYGIIQRENSKHPTLGKLFRNTFCETSWRYAILSASVYSHTAPSSRPWCGSISHSLDSQKELKHHLIHQYISRQRKPGLRRSRLWILSCQGRSGSHPPPPLQPQVFIKFWNDYNKFLCKRCI